MVQYSWLAVVPPMLFLIYRLAVLVLAWRVFDRTSDPESLKVIARFLRGRK